MSSTIFKQFHLELFTIVYLKSILTWCTLLGFIGLQIRRRINEDGSTLTTSSRDEHVTHTADENNSAYSTEEHMTHERGRESSAPQLPATPSSATYLYTASTLRKS